MDPMSPDANYTLSTLPRDECLQLLASQELGRLAVVDDGQPLIFPVNFALDGDLVVFRADPGTKLAAASLGLVAFEVDAVDAAAHTGWSVLVTGVGQEMTDAMDHLSERLLSISLSPWAPGDKAHWMRIKPIDITGRRLGPE
jgi:nitroimidazol reductase NimA-like FMN-containing flavoprotein (pyridoxamine 5'-phosphate oxidase superfamily)